MLRGLICECGRGREWKVVTCTEVDKTALVLDSSTTCLLCVGIQKIPNGFLY